MTELIFRYTPASDRTTTAELLAEIKQAAPSSQVTFLLEQYGIIRLEPEEIPAFSRLSFVIFIEASKSLYFTELSDSYRDRLLSCITPVNSSVSGLTGRGVLLGVVDSGIDYRHPEFLDSEGKTRILALWDQSAVSGAFPPPQGYFLGALYNEEQLNEALSVPAISAKNPVPSSDTSGHGTCVASICGGSSIGVAPEASFLIVKLGSPLPGGFPRTGELMQGIDFCVRESIKRNMPLALNLSFGNSYGSHLGTSLLESYIDSLNGVGKTVMVAGTGNEAAAGGHKQIRLSFAEEEVILTVSPYQSSFNLQIWKNYADVFDVQLLSPAGRRVNFIPGNFASFALSEHPMLESGSESPEFLRYIYHLPSFYQTAQELYLSFEGARITPGLWRILFTPRHIVDGTVRLWLPVESARNAQTRFLTPTPFGTFTIPSTAAKIISVGAYNSANDTYADFSGRGFEDFISSTVKPDLTAPGVNIVTALSGGGYTRQSGTSMAAPFVTGSCALLMEQGIVRGNDPYLYGEKIKAFLRKGARKLPSLSIYPNPYTGYGALCLGDSFF